MLFLPSSITKGVVLGFLSGVVVGALAYKYVKVDKKVNLDGLTDNIQKLATHVKENTTQNS